MKFGATMTHFPKTRLTELIARSGGLSQSAAIENAQRAVESLRDEGEEIMGRGITEIDAIVRAGRAAGALGDAELADIVAKADHVATLADAFGYNTLGKVARSLCDMADGLMRSGRHDLAPVEVHARAMALAIKAMSDSEWDGVIAELTKVRQHFDIAPMDGKTDAFAG